MLVISFIFYLWIINELLMSFKKAFLKIIKYLQIEYIYVIYRLRGPQGRS